MEVLRLHYAETLKAWRMRFLARREEAKPEDFDLAQMLRDFVAEYVAGFPLDSDTLDLEAPDSAVHARGKASFSRRISAPRPSVT